MKELKLKKNKVMILGGSGLVGKSTCSLFQKYGARLINLDLNPTKKKKNIKFIKFDITEFQNIEKNINNIISKFGCPKIFINCSYPVTEKWNKSNFSEVDLNTINDNLSLHLGSYIWISKIIAEKMRKNKIKGSIVQLSSIYGLVAQNLKIYEKTKMRENAVYPSIKSGIIANTKQLASYYGQFGIRVNSISPGAITGHVKESNKKQDKNFVKNYKELCPLKRLAKPSEIAKAVLFLGSEASSYITGSNLVIDGGWSII